MRTGARCTAAGNAKCSQHCGKQHVLSSENQTQNYCVTQRIHFWDYPPGKGKQKKCLTTTFTAAPPVTAQQWGRPRRPSTEGGAHRRGHTRATQGHAALKGKEMLPAARLGKLRAHMLRKKPVTERQILYNPA